MIAWWWLLVIVPLTFLAGVIFGSGLILLDLTGLHDYFYDLATEQPDLNRISPTKPRNSIKTKKKKNDEVRTEVSASNNARGPLRVVYLASDSNALRSN